MLHASCRCTQHDMQPLGSIRCSILVHLLSGQFFNPPEKVRHASRNADSAYPFFAIQKGTLSQHFVTHVVFPLVTHTTDFDGCGGCVLWVWYLMAIRSHDNNYCAVPTLHQPVQHNTATLQQNVQQHCSKTVQQHCAATMHQHCTATLHPQQHCTHTVQQHCATLQQKCTNTVPTLCSNTVHQRCAPTLCSNTVHQNCAATLCTNTVHQHCTNTVHQHCTNTNTAVVQQHHCNTVAILMLCSNTLCMQGPVGSTF